MVSIIGDSILNNINQHGLFNRFFKVRVKDHPGGTADDISDYQNQKFERNLI